MSKLHKTKNDLSETVRGKIVALVNHVLASSIDMTLQSKQAHWNVKGPSFIALHELFDKVYEEAGDWADLIAERAAQLGGVVNGTLAHIEKESVLPAYKLTLSSGPEHVNALSTALAIFGKQVRAAIDAVARLGDADTADIFTEVSSGVDKMLWFVESHAQAKQ